MSLFTYLQVGAVAGLMAAVQTASQQITAPAMMTVVCEKEPVCGHFYNDGKLFKTITSTDATISVSLTDTGKYLRADIVVTDTSANPVDILPKSFTLNVIKPEGKQLSYVPPEKMISSASHHNTFANIMQGAAAGAAQSQSTTNTTTSGTVSATGSDGSSANGTYNGNSTSTTSAPDYAARARANERIAERNASFAAASQDLLANSLLAITLANGQSKAGRVYFERTKHHSEVVLSMPIGGTTYVFPFTFDR